MPQPFDPGYVAEPFLTLCSDYPGADVYPSQEFRVEWGPIFHRGRLDGSARVLVLGQDPAQHETIVRRILVGEAGRRVQGLLARLGITTSYVFVNTYLYSVYGSVKAATRRHPALVDYRNRWLQALLVGQQVEAVIALGQAADGAWAAWKATPQGQATKPAYAAVTHPTQPESSAGGDRTRLALATARMLRNWNAALQALHPGLTHPDAPVPLALYGDAWAEGDRLPIPAIDYPAGLPAWMRDNDGWAARKGADETAKRRNITLTVSKGVVA
ncbi:uracil-DNA glycosylase family protein [Variovorax sp. J22P168]|uniref:uracil-DNA glycosylase family protein n=1 Tax=Variovorax jilinensis TaxID=3053513 RepID=UPI002577EB12|nr:uracil-DNA glycosylase family protein [Variovorax sp. J22P168]MDM0015033.1 uracil-DNA glycosylase family protein [Variovorax sp. J22P168]